MGFKAVLSVKGVEHFSIWGLGAWVLLRYDQNVRSTAKGVLAICILHRMLWVWTLIFLEIETRECRDSEIFPVVMSASGSEEFKWFCV
jgi:hypothetical protein